MSDSEEEYFGGEPTEPKEKHTLMAKIVSCVCEKEFLYAFAVVVIVVLVYILYQYFKAENFDQLATQSGMLAAQTSGAGMRFMSQQSQPVLGPRNTPSAEEIQAAYPSYSRVGRLVPSPISESLIGHREEPVFWDVSTLLGAYQSDNSANTSDNAIVARMKANSAVRGDQLLASWGPSPSAQQVAFTNSLTSELVRINAMQNLGYEGFQGSQVSSFADDRLQKALYR